MSTYNLKDRFINAKRRLFDRVFDNLNEQQRNAVYSINGPLLILAGAGSGKTTVLVNRIAYILKYGNSYFDENMPYAITEDEVTSLENAVNLSKEEIEEILMQYSLKTCAPWEVLAITFTNKAAREIKERLAAKLDYTDEEGVVSYSKDIWAGTFHSICIRILKSNIDKLGYSKDFSIYDSDDTKKLITSCMKDLNIDDSSLPVKSVMNAISRAKDKLIPPSAFLNEFGTDFRQKLLSKIYTMYQSRLEDANALDFDDIIVKTVKLLSENDDVRSYYQNKFKYVCVDEYQDTNYAQFMLTLLLSGRYMNLMVVGDDDQSIYRFRGATIENILNFDKTVSNAKIIKLEQNYRSTKMILGAANSVIKNNFGRRGKELWTAGDNGDKVVVRQLENQIEEAKYIVNSILDTVTREKRKFSDFAILYRVNAQANTLESVFAKSAIPYRILGGLRFTDRKEIKDIASYLYVILNPSDNLRLKRIVNEPKRKIGDTTIAAVEQLANEEGVSMYEIMKNASNYTALSKASSKLRGFVDIIDKLREVEESESVSKLIEKTITDTGYLDMLIAMGESERDRIDNLNEFISTAVEYESREEEPTLMGFLEEFALVADIDNYDKETDAVVLMTIHSSKGLEFPLVFLPGLEDGLFPSMQSIMFPEELEEERRLAYVAITRAREKLVITHTKERLLYGKTQYNPIARFVTEIPDEYIDNQTPKQRREFARNDRFERETNSSNATFNEFRKKVDTPSSIGKKADFETFGIGERVIHITFGQGTVLSVKEMGADKMYEIAFDNVGTKKLMATYAKLKRI